ncbi:MAG: ABC transporter substrate-binding protein [Fusobacteriaceae bacterium]
MKKSLFFKILLSFIIIFSVSYSDSSEKINFNYPTGITSLTVEKMLQDELIEKKEMNYNSEKNSSALINSVLKESADIAIVPSSIVSIISEKKLNYSVLGTVGWGSFYILGYENLNSISELQGKKLAINGKNLTPDTVLKNILKKNKIEEVEISYYPTPSEVAIMLLGKKIAYAAIPEPLVSNLLKKDKNLKIIFSFNEEWKNLYNDNLGYPQSTLIVKNSFLEKNQDFVDHFLMVYKKSLEFLVKNPETNIYEKENIDIQSIKRFNLKFVSGKDSYKSYQKFIEIIEGKKIDDKIFK